uniref:Uncharacterized protein n=1 Tax=Roseihalotalea indica TaxID=2867963 RepID=A0AA49JJF7_9BACT|nr:hypothetical protein K4G66_13770 [Tunicatimonas sp. TK19036]
MQPEQAHRIFDLKAFLSLREDVREQMAKELSVSGITWSTENISILKEKIIAAAPAGIDNLSPRSMHENIKAPITDKTEIPHSKNNRLDLMCIYLGYDNFTDYKNKKGSSIESIVLETNTTYHILRKNQYQERKETTYMVGYYYNYFKNVDKSILSLEHDTGVAILNMLNPTPHTSLTLDYIGSFEITRFGYLNLFGRLLQFEYDISIYARVYYDDHRKGYKYFTGIYTATSAQDYACFGGVNLLEKENSYEEALQKAQAPTEEKIVNFLKGKRLSTERKSYYSLDELSK